MQVQVRGLSMHVERTGTGPPLVLIHGGGLDLETWDEFVPLLDDAFTVWRFDLRGYGQSFGSLTPVKGTDWIEDLFEMFRVLGIDRAGIVGWAMGGAIGAAFAAKYPEYADWLVLLGVPGPKHQVKLDGIEARQALIDAGTPASQIVAQTFDYSRAAFSPTVLRDNPAAAERLRTALERNLPKNYAELVIAFKDVVPTVAVLEGISCPTLIVVGEHDARTPPTMSQELQAHINDSELTVLKDCGHFYPFEQPVECARLIRGFAHRHFS